MAAVISFGGIEVVILNGQARSETKDPHKEEVLQFVQSHIDDWHGYAPAPDVAKARDFVAHCGGTLLLADLPEYTDADAGRVY